jgi:hypothetical protein
MTTTKHIITYTGNNPPTIAEITQALIDANIDDGGLLVVEKFKDNKKAVKARKRV